MDKKETKEQQEENHNNDKSEAEENKHATQLDNKKIQELQEQNDALQDKLLRSMAECENIRNRAAKQVEEAREFSITNFAKDLVPVIDNLSRAIEHAPAEPSAETKAIIDGVRMTKKELDTVFSKYGLNCINPSPGEKFDYNFHNAISQIVTDEFEVGTIVSTMQAGYKIKGRLLRPAAVVVAKK